METNVELSSLPPAVQWPDDYRSELDRGEESEQERVEHIAKHFPDQFSRFGAWEQWSEEDISYLLEELRGGHICDDDKVPGFIAATEAIRIAQIANQREEPSQHEVNSVLWSMAEALAYVVNRAASPPAILLGLNRCGKLNTCCRKSPDFKNGGGRLLRN